MPRTERDLSLTCRDNASAPSALKVQVLHQLSNGVGETTRTLELPIPLNPKLTPPSVVAEIDRLPGPRDEVIQDAFDVNPSLSQARHARLVNWRTLDLPATSRAAAMTPARWVTKEGI